MVAAMEKKSAPACNTAHRTHMLPGLDASFFDLPTQKRVQTPTGMLLRADSRSLFDFVAVVESAHDLFPKHWCRHAATIVMKRALAKSEPVNRLVEQSTCRES